MNLGFIIPNFPNEKRVALLPNDISGFENQIIIEKNFGLTMDISDKEYKDKGCLIKDRKEIFEECDYVFSLKLIQPTDYEMLRKHQVIIGWTHPTGSGQNFFDSVAQEKRLIIVDLDNMYPRIFYKNTVKTINWIKPNFIKRNSFNAGYASTIHALVNYGLLPNCDTKIAVLASGNTSQGAFVAASKFTNNIELFYRKTMSEFYENIGKFEIIINGIEVDTPGKHIIHKEQLNSVKKGCLVIDAAADAGNAIEGTHYTTIQNPIYLENGLYFYVVNNSPSIFHRTASVEISKCFSNNIYNKNVEIFKKSVL